MLEVTKGFGSVDWTAMMSQLGSRGSSSLTVGEIKDLFRTDLEHGLTSEEAYRRLIVHGPNNFDIAVEDPLWRKYLDQVIFVLCVVK